jgi:hypothetical protein
MSDLPVLTGIPDSENWRWPPLACWPMADGCLSRLRPASGKTLSTLFPAVKALGEGKLERIFYLTARTVGRAIAEKALVDLSRARIESSQFPLRPHIDGVRLQP